MLRLRAVFLFGFCALALLIFSFCQRGSQLSFIPFDESMCKANPAFSRCYAGNKQKDHQWQCVKKLYEKYLTSSFSEKPRIPKIIHQIWIGGPLPEKYVSLQKTWQKNHPDWEYHLWTDADVAHFPFMNRKRFEEAINIGEKADIFRYEILYQHGGLYVDTDFECLRPFDIFHHTCDFYTGIEASLDEKAVVAIPNGLIGSVPAHPIIRYCLDRIGKKSPGLTPSQVLKVSGPGCFKRAFLKCCKMGKYRNVAFPFTYFYPLPASHKGSLMKEIYPESYGIHYWDTSWIKSS
jgi:mannosyltransferase OCH1-like enzyme